MRSEESSLQICSGGIPKPATWFPVIPLSRVELTKMENRVRFSYASFVIAGKETARKPADASFNGSRDCHPAQAGHHKRAAEHQN